VVGGGGEGGKGRKKGRATNIYEMAPPPCIIFSHKDSDPDLDKFVTGFVLSNTELFKPDPDPYPLPVLNKTFEMHLKTTP
jgi:hypothetical protein